MDLSRGAETGATEARPMGMGSKRKRKWWKGNGRGRSHETAHIGTVWLVGRHDSVLLEKETEEGAGTGERQGELVIEGAEEGAGKSGLEGHERTAVVVKMTASGPRQRIAMAPNETSDEALPIPKRTVRREAMLGEEGKEGMHAPIRGLPQAAHATAIPMLARRYHPIPVADERSLINARAFSARSPSAPCSCPYRMRQSNEIECGSNRGRDDEGAKDDMSEVVEMREARDPMSLAPRVDLVQVRAGNGTLLQDDGAGSEDVKHALVAGTAAETAQGPQGVQSVVVHREQAKWQGSGVDEGKTILYIAEWESKRTGVKSWEHDANGFKLSVIGLGTVTSYYCTISTVTGPPEPHFRPKTGRQTPKNRPKRKLNLRGHRSHPLNLRSKWYSRLAAQQRARACSVKRTASSTWTTADNSRVESGRRQATMARERTSVVQEKQGLAGSGVVSESSRTSSGVTSDDTLGLQSTSSMGRNFVDVRPSISKSLTLGGRWAAAASWWWETGAINCFGVEFKSITTETKIVATVPTFML
ncbi:hypothetical protein C8R45DRAFT_1174194 [Mycena sanguinolenta]|nr:hypothetical protein C8R45DRAFT_1174194 [Mycena sanguinolenta]